MPEKVIVDVAVDSVTEDKASYPATTGSTIVTLFDEVDAAPEAVELVPNTVNVYEVASESPVTVIGLLLDVPVIEPGVEVAVNVVAVPPVVAAVKGTEAVVPEALTVPIAGLSGTSAIATPDLVTPDVFALLILAN
jgi:hypothetical protein